jgi:hypothetical protein
MTVITVMKTADFVKMSMLPFCSWATPWLRNAKVSARSVAVLLHRCCKNIAVLVIVLAYLFEFAKIDALCR